MSSKKKRGKQRKAAACYHGSTQEAFQGEYQRALDDHLASVVHEAHYLEGPAQNFDKAYERDLSGLQLALHSFPVKYPFILQMKPLPITSLHGVQQGG